VRRPTLLEISDSKPVFIFFAIVWALTILAIVVGVVATILGYP
jgi:hypothetical protein